MKKENPHQKDLISKEFFGRLSHFASLFNACYFNEEVVDPELCKPADPESSQNAGHHRIRDLVMEADDVLLHLEIQTSRDPHILFRMLDYQASAYLKQKHQKARNAKIKPIRSLVLYLGSKPWNPKRKLSDVLPHFPGQKMEFEMVFFDIRQAASVRFKELDVNQVLRMIQYGYKEDVEGLLNDPYFKNVPVSMEVLEVVSAFVDLDEEWLTKIKREGGLDMAHQGFMNWAEGKKMEGRQEGILEASRNIIISMIKKGFTVNEIASATELSEDLIRQTIRSIQS